MILTQVLCPERAQLFFIMATAFISLCHFRCAFLKKVDSVITN